MNALQTFLAWLTGSNSVYPTKGWVGSGGPDVLATEGYPGSDPYTEGSTLYRLPAGVGDPDAAVGGGWAEQSYNRRNITTIGGGDTSWYNPGLGCFRAMHYGERQIPGRRYLAYIAPRGFSEWLR